MPSSLDFVEYITHQLRDAGPITHKKMFGEYGVYCAGKIFALICDNQLFIKITPAGRSVCPTLPQAAPYPGAKPYFLIEDAENKPLLTRLVQQTCTALPMSKPKTKQNRPK